MLHPETNSYNVKKKCCRVQYSLFSLLLVTYFCNILATCLHSCAPLVFVSLGNKLRSFTFLLLFSSIICHKLLIPFFTMFILLPLNPHSYSVFQAFVSHINRNRHFSFLHLFLLYILNTHPNCILFESLVTVCH